MVTGDSLGLVSGIVIICFNIQQETLGERVGISPSGVDASAGLGSHGSALQSRQAVSIPTCSAPSPKAQLKAEPFLMDTPGEGHETLHAVCCSGSAFFLSLCCHPHSLPGQPPYSAEQQL